MDVAAGKRLAPSDWTTAALMALRETGLSGVAVEPLAARLGTTKGSFYWHFPDRQALVAAALERWEHEETDAVIAALGSTDDPARRLELLAGYVFDPQHEPVLVVSLLADAGHSLVAAALERVTRRRVDYLGEQYRALGFDEGDARARALLAYTAFLGMAQLRRHLPALAPDDALARHAALLRQLLAPAPSGDPGRDTISRPARRAPARRRG